MAELKSADPWEVEMAEEAIDSYRRALDAIDQRSTCDELYKGLLEAAETRGGMQSRINDAASGGDLPDEIFEQWEVLEDQYKTIRHAAARRCLRGR